MSSGYEERGRWKEKEGCYFPLALLLVFICKPTRRYGGAGPHHDCTGRLWREIREELRRNASLAAHSPLIPSHLQSAVLRR